MGERLRKKLRSNGPEGRSVTSSMAHSRALVETAAELEGASLELSLVQQDAHLDRPVPATAHRRMDWAFGPITGHRFTVALWMILITVGLYAFQATFCRPQPPEPAMYATGRQPKRPRRPTDGGDLRGAGVGFPPAHAAHQARG